METALSVPLVIVGSARKSGNTYTIANAVLQGIDVKIIELANHTIVPYSYNGNYGEDDFMDIATQMLQHNTIIFATPVYWYAMSGMMKTFFDRLTHLVTTHKPSGRQLKGKNILLIATGTDAGLPEGFEVPFQQTAEYFDAQYKGAVYFCTKEKYPATHPEGVIAFRQLLLSL